MTALDVAAYIIELSVNIGEPITHMKLQKLVYYSFAWHAVETNSRLFDEPIEAWQYGPVIRSVYDTYKKYGADIIRSAEPTTSPAIRGDIKDLIEDVFNVYGRKTAIDLVSLTHSEAPWRDTYNGNNDQVISFDMIYNYYLMKKAENE